MLAGHGDGKLREEGTAQFLGAADIANRFSSPGHPEESRAFYLQNLKQKTQPRPPGLLGRLE